MTLFGVRGNAQVDGKVTRLNLSNCRFYAIVYPLKRFRWKKALIPFSVLFSVVYNLPRFFELK